MERHFHEDLKVLTTRVADMGALVESRTRDAVLREWRSDLAVQVASGDTEVNNLENEIDDLCLKFLATQSPVASDLRLVRSVIKVITDLERVGDQAVNMAQTIIRLLGMPRLPPVVDVGHLGETALAMLHDSITSFVTQDVVLGQSVVERDDRADSLRDSCFRVLLTHMMANPAVIESAFGLVLVSRCLERVADHATNIAEETTFAKEGRVVRHHGGAVATE
jgi:phosphate transport system protein